MAWEPNFRKGTDLPTWDWLTPYPGGSSFHGAGSAYDGSRYFYFVIQHGHASTASSGIAQLWRFDTVLEAWGYLAQLPGAAWTGADLEYDSTRNVLYCMNGNATTWQAFSLNLVPVVIANLTVQPFVLTPMTPVLPATAGSGSSLTMPDDLSVPATIDTAVAATGSTATALLQDAVATSVYRAFGSGLIGLQVRFTSGALAGVARTITGVTNPNSLTVAALPSAPAPGDTFIVELPSLAATGGTTTTVVATGASWPVNGYASSDVVFTSGALSGQRRRIASNTADTLTLAPAYTPPAVNPRTGPLPSAPTSGDTFRVVPSADYLYYQTGGATSLHRIDVAQTGSAPTWQAVASAPGATGGGANTLYAQAYDPFGILCVRGAGTNAIYRYAIGPNSWSALTTYGAETLNTGASSCLIHGRRRLFLQKEVSTRSYLLDLTTGVAEPGPTIPYGNSVAYDGKRSRFIRTADGVEWLYHLRAGGQEMFRVPLEWMV